MESNLPAAASSNPGEQRPSRFSLWRLWQVPVFFVGVVAVAAACLSRGFIAPDPVRQLHHDLSEARRLLHRRDSDPDEALRYAQRAVDGLMYDQSKSAEAFYLLGSAYVRLAEPEGEAAEENWHKAKQYLLEAQNRGLSGEDLGRLNYRLAKVGFYIHDDPRNVVFLLKANAGLADNRAEALTLLSKAYLRLTPPNITEALEANKKLREEVPQIGEEVLGPAKLAGAKLLLQLGQREEARKTLEKINKQAPPATLAEKQMILAGLYQEEQKWPQAAELWRAVLTEKRVPLSEAGGVLYNLGVCYRHLEQPKQAIETWIDCLNRGNGEEAQAAALALAELYLHQANLEKTVAMLAESVAKIRKAADWKNTFVELPRIRELFEKAMTTLRQAHRYDLAVRCAELYERVAIAPRAQIRRAELGSEWAQQTQEQARIAKDAATHEKADKTAVELFRQAAVAHAEAARICTAKDDKEKHGWMSAVCSYEGRDYLAAAEKLTTIVEAEKENIERQSEAWYLLAESFRNLRDMDKATTAYKRCIDCNANCTCRARYQLAMIEIEAGRIDAATKELEQNLLMEHRDPDPEAHEKSLFALCSLLYRSAATLPQNFRRVVQHLEGPLDHFAVTPEAVRARFQLADSYRQLVAQSTVNRYMSEKMSDDAHKHYLEVNQRYWKRAAEEFVKLEELVLKAELAALLSLNQQMEIPFRVAECYFNLGEYKKAQHKYEDLAKKWANQPECLRALGETIKCFAALHDYTNLKTRADELQSAVATTKGLNESQKQQWLDWLTQVKKFPLANPKP